MSSNLRHQLLSLSLLVGIVAPWAVFAQTPTSSIGSDSIEDHVTRLECISDAHSQLLTQLRQQLSDSQSDTDSLRGQIQEDQYQLNQVVERQKQILLQTDSLSSGGVVVQSTGNDQSGMVASTTPTTNVGTTNAGTPVRSGDTSTDYGAAIALAQDEFRQNGTMVVFQNFIRNYPDSTYLPGVDYWLGQLNYNKGKKDDAAYYFASVVKDCPESPKIVDAMFKTGVITQDKGDTAEAKVVYRQVISKYPGTDGVKQAQGRLNVM